MHDLRRAAEVRHLDAPLGRGPALSAQIKLRRSDEQVLPDGRAAERLRGLDCGERVHLAGALLDGWHVQIGRRAREQLADDRRGRRRAVVALPVGLDDERRSAGDERRRLARAAEALQRRRLAGEVRALLVDRGVRAAQCPVRLARRDEVEHAAAHREACRFDRGDLVVQPPVRELVRVLRFLRVVAERRARAGADDRRITRRRAWARAHAGVPGALDDGDARRDRLLVELAGEVLGRIRDRIAAERLADDIRMVVAQGVVEALEDDRVVGAVRVAEHLHPDQGCARGDAAHRDVAALGQRVRGRVEVRDVVGLPALRSDRARVAERLGGAGRRVQSVPAEVLVVDEHVAAIGPDEVRVVDVQSVGEERDLDALAGGERLRLGRAGVLEGGVRRLERLGLEQGLARVRGAHLLSARAAAACGCGTGARRVDRRRQLYDRVRHDLRDRAAVLERRLLGRRHRRRERVERVETAIDMPARATDLLFDPGVEVLLGLDPR